MARLTLGRPKGGTRELAAAIALPLATGCVSGLLSMRGIAGFAQLNRPPLMPPGWLFPVVWTMLYVLMGLSSYLVWRWQGRRYELRQTQRRALLFYLAQLFFNFCWSLLFFVAQWHAIAFVWLLVLFLLVLAYMLNARRIDNLASMLMIPYAVWIVFAGYLNLAVAILN